MHSNLEGRLLWASAVGRSHQSAAREAPSLSLTTVTNLAEVPGVPLGKLAVSKQQGHLFLAVPLLATEDFPLHTAMALFSFDSLLRSWK